MAKRRRMLVSAGPTYEPLDAVRYLANRSSGRLGVAVAVAAQDAGWDVTLCLGPSAVVPPTGVVLRRFESARELETLLEAEFPHCDALVMAAAVADYRPARPAAGKLPRADERLTLELEPVPDLVAACATRKSAEQRIIAFALEEPQSLAERAAEKLRRKGVDAIVANPLTTMGAEGIEARVITAAGQTYFPDAVSERTTGAVDKAAFAAWLVRWMERQWWPSASQA